MHIDIAHLIIVLVVILISMTLHEAMHGFMAYWLGDDTAKEQGRLTLNPLHHIDLFLTILLPLSLALLGLPVFGGAKPVPYNPERVRGDEWGAALVGLAGPLTNFVIAFICFGLYATIAGPAVQPLLATAVSVNLGFFVFNMLPIPPLDGSHILRNLLPPDLAYRYQSLERYSILIMLVFIATPVLSVVLMPLFQLVYGGYKILGDILLF